MAHRLSCSGIFPDQGSNPGLLRWQADSLPLSHQGSPVNLISGGQSPNLDALLWSLLILCQVISSLFLPFLAMVRIHPWESVEGYNGWSLPTRNARQKGLYAWESHGAPFSFIVTRVLKSGGGRQKRRSGPCNMRRTNPPLLALKMGRGHQPRNASSL